MNNSATIKGGISFPQGHGSLMHNNRAYPKDRLPKNIDQDRTITNQKYEKNYKTVRAAYKDIFQKSVDEYNQKQKRADRKITSYYDKIQESKHGEHLFYEDVLQQGKKEIFDEHPELREVVKECLQEYVEKFEERNTHLKIIGAYIHMDEASPHLHLDYIPVADGYSNGMKQRNALDRAMKQMGFLPQKESKKNNATKMQKERERQVFKDICIAHGLEVEEEKSLNRNSLTPEEYRSAITTARDQGFKQAQTEFEELTKATADPSRNEHVKKALFSNDVKVPKEVQDKAQEALTIVGNLSQEKQRAEQEAQRIKAVANKTAENTKQRAQDMLDAANDFYQQQQAELDQAKQKAQEIEQQANAYRDEQRKQANQYWERVQRGAVDNLNAQYNNALDKKKLTAKQISQIYNTQNEFQQQLRQKMRYPNEYEQFKNKMQHIEYRRNTRSDDPR